MTTRLTTKGDVHFPGVCQVCKAPASQTYTISKSLTVAKRTYTVTLPMPLCDTHYQIATWQNPKEKAIGRIGLIVGAVAALAVLGGLVAYWSSSGQGVNIGTVLLAAFVGIGIGLAIWVAVAFFVAPRFGDPESREARSAVTIRHFWPASGDLQLVFADDSVAELFVAENPDKIIEREQL